MYFPVTGLLVGTLYGILLSPLIDVGGGVHSTLGYALGAFSGRSHRFTF